MFYYATIGQPMKVITKGDSCGLFRNKKHAMTPDEARSFFYNSEGLANVVFLYENPKDAKIAAAYSAANLCNISSENKFLKHKAYTTPIFIVEVPDFLITREWQSSSVKFTSDVEKKVASYFGVKDLDAEKTFKNYPCSKDIITSIYHVTICHPYFHHKDIDMESPETKKYNQEQYDAVMMRP